MDSTSESEVFIKYDFNRYLTFYHDYIRNTYICKDLVLYGWLHYMSKEDLTKIMSILRVISKVLLNENSLTPVELERAKCIAAQCYLSHTNREIDLKNDEFQLIVDLLKYKPDFPSDAGISIYK